MAHVKLKIDNVYDDGTVTTHVDTEVESPTNAELADEYARDEWAWDELYPHTGTGQTEGDAGYFVEVVSSDDDRLTGLKFEWC